MASEFTPEHLDRLNLGFAMHVSWIMAVLGSVALAFGIATVPIAGANCPYLREVLL